jgi:hypothetical protein
MKLILKRSEIGTRAHYDQLRDKYCAVGEYLRQLGVDAKVLDGRDFAQRMVKVAPWLASYNRGVDYSSAWSYITSANDRHDEDGVIAEFAKHGVEVEYID